VERRGRREKDIQYVIWRAKGGNRGEVEGVQVGVNYVTGLGR